MTTRGALSALTVAAILACGGGGGSKDAGPEEVAQSEACAQYVSCVSAVEPSTLGAVTAAYGLSGDCWESAATAHECTEACEAALSALHRAYPEAPECDDGSAVPSSTWLGEAGQWRFDVTDTPEYCDGDHAQTPLRAILTFYGGDDPTFVIEGSVTFIARGYAGDSLTCDVTAVTCSLDGHDFACDPFSAGVGCDTFQFTFTGTFGDTWYTAAGTMAGEDPTGEEDCHPTSEMEGSRSG